MSRLLFDRVLSPYRKLIRAILLMVACIGSSHAANYNIDPTHTNVRFALDHFKTFTNTGGFYNVTGQLQYDPSAKTGSISLVIPINSLSTGNKKFDIMLTGRDFFDREQFPLAYFESTKWYFANGKANPNVTRVDGNLTLHGETNPVTLTANKFNCYFSPILKKSVCRGYFTTRIDRTKWNINKYVLFGMTKNLTLNIQVEAAKQ
ncbi:YceI family protein [Psychrobacter sp. 72-O-c]|uniref:YceI family protein n=1 Tax=Psychrobacter sp. 72-O-c TaxID=2774125 RepID=UPI001917B806|nr:YceI family protein [Psychrobacter sp. 72-O-c]